MMSCARILKGSWLKVVNSTRLSDRYPYYVSSSNIPPPTQLARSARACLYFPVYMHFDTLCCLLPRARVVRMGQTMLCDIWNTAPAVISTCVSSSMRVMWQ